MRWTKINGFVSICACVISLSFILGTSNIISDQLSVENNESEQSVRLVEKLIFDSEGKWISGSYEGFLEAKYMNNETNLMDSTYWYVLGENIYEFSKHVRMQRRRDLFGMPENITLEELARSFSREEWASFWFYDRPEDAFVNGFARYWQGTQDQGGVKNGYIDYTGTLITPPLYDTFFFQNFSENLAAVTIKNEDGTYKAGYIDQSGNVVIPMIYEFAGSFYNGLAEVYIDEEWRYINKSGEFVTSAKDEMSQSYNEVGIVPYQDRTAVDVLTLVSRDGTLNIVQPNHYGVIDSKGNVILPMEYDYISILDGGYVMAQKGNLNILFYDTMYSNGGGIAVKINGSQINFDQVPIMENERVLVPFRKIFEELGASVDWNGETQTVTAKKDDIEISLQIGSDILNKNGEKITLDVPAKIVKDRTLVPIRAVSEGLGARVEWDGMAQTVLISME